MVRNKLFLFGTNLLRNSLLWLPLLFSTSIISIVIGYTFALAEVEYIPENYNHPLTYQDCGFNQFGGNTGGINSNSLPPFAVCGDKGTKTHRFVKDSADGPGRSLRLKADFPPPPNGGYFGIFHSLAGLTDTDVTFDGVNRVKAFSPISLSISTISLVATPVNQSSPLMRFDFAPNIIAPVMGAIV